MTILKVEQFGGIVPKLDDKTLPDNCAVDAINCDLIGHGIKPMNGHLFVRNSFLGDTICTTDESSGIAQHPTPCFGVFNQISAGYTTHLPLGVTPLVVGATDYLWYAVFLPASPAPIAGQGCVDILFSDATTLGNAVADQNALGAKAGNLSSQASGKWYLRKIPLGGQLASDGSAITGKTITHFRAFQNHTNATLLGAYYAFAVVTDSSFFTNIRCFFIDPNRVNAPSSASTFIITDDRGIDIDDLAFLYVSAPSVVNGVIDVPFSAQYRGKKLLYQVQPAAGIGITSPVGINGHDVVYQFGTASAFYIYGPKASTAPSPSRAQGWIAVPEPDAALSAPSIVGGTAANVTRSYVFTRVSEDGLESGPSPAVVATGHPDGSWNFSSIPTWNGTDQFDCSIAGSKFHGTRIYRTPVGSTTYRLVGTLNDNTTSFNDAVLDANLGAALTTTNYKRIPDKATGMSMWTNGMMAAVTDSMEVSFCTPYGYHSWPLANRYTITQRAVACAAFGDRMFVLTFGNPVAFWGTDPSALQWAEILNGEACLSAKGIVPSSSGIFYPGRTGWGLLNYNGYQNVTAQYFSETQFPSVVPPASTVAMFDRRRLIWITQGQTKGYMLDASAQERGLVKFEISDPIYGMSYYPPRGNRWITYTNSTLTKMGLLFGDANTKLKWTWKSKLLKTPGAVSMAVAKIESSEWGTLSVEMKKRDLFYTASPTAWVTATQYNVDDFVTNGGQTYRCLTAHTSGTFATDLAALKWVLNSAVYSIDISGLTQSEAWVYLKVWADPDDSGRTVLVYDNFVSSQKPVKLLDAVKSDCWQFEIRGNISVTSVSIATSAGELNAQKE